MMTVFAEVEVGELFMDCSDHVYYTKLDNKAALRISPGGDQPEMRQEILLH